MPFPPAAESLGGSCPAEFTYTGKQECHAELEPSEYVSWKSFCTGTRQPGGVVYTTLPGQGVLLSLY